MIRQSLAALALVAGAAGVAFGHAGPRLEVVVENGRLAARGANTATDDLRPYLNAISARWEGGAGELAVAGLPGFDVFFDNRSRHGSGAADDLQGGDLVLTLADAAAWDTATPGAIQLDDLSTPVAIGFGDDFDNIVMTTEGGSLELISEVGALGVSIDDLDPDFFAQSGPASEVFVLAWTISTTAAPGGAPIGASDYVFTILTPDSSAFIDDGIELERYLATPLVAGDLDRDGVTDANDFGVWAASFGEEPRFVGSGADASRDGIVNTADFTVYRDAVAPPSVSLLSAIAVPEPGGAVLLAIAAVCGPRRFRRR